MKNKYILFILLTFSVTLPFFFISYSNAGAETAETVNICGEITAPHYEGGWILITALRVIDSVQEVEPIVKHTIPHPGEYCIEVPRGVGYINLEVFNLDSETYIPDDTDTQRDIRTPFALYADNPLMVGSEDIAGVDIVFEGIPSYQVMAGYRGETIVISGEVYMPHYEEGSIVVTLNDGYFGEPNIASVNMDRPGKYSVKVPKNHGNIYIGAFNVLPGKSRPGPGTPKGEYRGNPLNVKAENIYVVNFNIQ